MHVYISSSVCLWNYCYETVHGQIHLLTVPDALLLVGGGANIEKIAVLCIGEVKSSMQKKLRVIEVLSILLVTRKDNR